MKKILIARSRLFIIFVLVGCSCFSFGQRVVIDTEQIKELVNLWNTANNTRDPQGLNSLYSDTLIFYTQNLPKQKCLALKRELFQRQPRFQQKIVTGLTFSAYTSGLLKCDFTKEVYMNGIKRQFPSYLLVRYTRRGYFIVGESDYTTDKILKYRLAIGDRLPTSAIQSQKVNDVIAKMVRNDSVAKNPKRGDSTSSFATVKEIIQISQDFILSLPNYVLIIAGALLCSMLLFVIGRKGRGKKKNGASKNGGKILIPEQSVGFTAFAELLFDPLYFRFMKISRLTNDDGVIYPDFQLEFANKETKAVFAVACLYQPFIADKQVMVVTAKQLDSYNRFQDEKGLNVYVLLGVAGQPDNPKEIYCIPLNKISNMATPYADLQPYRKYGMFFYTPQRQLH
jgi:hypothetical protein